MAASNIASDLAKDLERLLATTPNFFSGVSRPLITTIAAGDGMNSGDLEYYLKCGRSALDCINLALSRTTQPTVNISSILDFGCGFGRVTRWLLAAFPSARVVAMDVDKKAIDAIRSIFKVDAHLIDKKWTRLPEYHFDLIWVGSLFTHISYEKSLDLLRLLANMLNVGGVLAITIHGQYVVNRLQARTKDYGLTDEAILDVVAQFQKYHFGFVPYHHTSDYGISVTTQGKLFELGAQAHLKPLCFVDRGWIKHQDLVAFSR